MDISDAYLATWNADDAQRDALLAEHWSESATYTDPLAAVAGREAIRATIEAVKGQFPGHVLQALGSMDAHHNVARFHWGLGLPNEEPVALGFDVIELDGDGRIHHVFGFLDRVPTT